MDLHITQIQEYNAFSLDSQFKFFFKVGESSQKTSQTIFSFRVTVANILQTHRNVHKPIHAKDHS